MDQLTKIVTAIILLLTVFRNYRSPIAVNQLSVLLVLIIIMIQFLILLSKKARHNLNGRALSNFVILTIWTIVSYFISYFAENYTLDYINLLVLILFTLVIIFSIQGAFDYKFGINFYVNCAVAFSLYLILQAVLAYGLNIFLTSKLPLLSLLNEKAFVIPANYYSTYGWIKLASIFAEPAQFCQYVIPALCFSLFGFDKYYQKRINIAVVLSVAIVLSTSANGILIAFAIWCLYFYYKNKKNLFKLLFVVFGIFIITAIAYQIPLIQKSLINLFIPENTTASKADYRIYRGFLYYLQLPIKNKILGVGFLSSDDFSLIYRITTKYDYSWNTVTEYFNNMASILIYSGIIGGLMYIKMVYEIFKSKIASIRVLSICFAALCISSSFYYNEMWILYMIWLLAPIYKIKEEYVESKKIASHSSKYIIHR